MASDLATWNWSSTAAVQVRDDAIVVTSTDGDPWFRSPEISIPSSGTNVVVATVNVGVNACARAQLIWRYACSGDRNAHAVLAAGTHNYIFIFDAATVGPDRLVGLRFDPLLCPGTARVRALEIGRRSP